MQTKLSNMTLKTLEYLIKAYIGGDEKAAKSIYLMSYDLVSKTARRFFNNPELAKDAIQNTYCKIFKNLSKLNYADEISTFAWMKRICINECIVIKRKNKKWSGSKDVPVEFTVRNSQRLVCEDILNLIGKLPFKQRTAFELFAIQGYRHSEIGNILGIRTCSSRSLVNRARKFLRRQCSTFHFSHY